MNRIITSIVILAILAAGSFAAVAEVCSFTDRISGEIDVIEQAFTEKDSEKCVNAAKELQKDWDGFTDFSILIFDAGQALEITSSIAEIVSFAEDDNDEIYASCDRAQAQIALFRASHTPSVWKIL